jgi:4-hydroxy-tetrahydrodipicolinate synthase
MTIRGALTALVTPFTSDDDIDVVTLERIARLQIDGGIDGLVVAGTTGESPNLDDDDKHRAVDAVLAAARGKVPVVIGTGTNSTRGTVQATKAAMSWGCDAALVVCPYYNKPTQEGLFRHFKAVREETGMPIIAYNVPGRTASDLLPETIARLVEIEAIVAVKDATADMRRAVETLADVDPTKPFTLLSGDDFTILPFVACGGAGVISVVSNLVPGDTAHLVRETVAGNWDVARRLQQRLAELSSALFARPNPIPIKAAMAMIGLGENRLRLPLTPIDAAGEALVRRALETYGGLLP